MGQIIAAAALAAAFGAPAAAADDDVDCAHAVAQLDMNICADREYQRVDAELNKVYRQVTAAMDAHEKSLLAEAERAWVAFRDKECKYESAENEGGSIYPMEYSGCLTSLTKDRIRQLKQCNGPACPSP